MLLASESASKRKAFKIGLMSLANLSLQNQLASLTEGFIRTRNYGEVKYHKVFRTVRIVEEIIALRDAELKHYFIARLMVNCSLRLRKEEERETMSQTPVSRKCVAPENSIGERTLEEQMIGMVVRNNVILQ